MMMRMSMRHRWPWRAPRSGRRWHGTAVRRIPGRNRPGASIMPVSELMPLVSEVASRCRAARLEPLIGSELVDGPRSTYRRN